MFAALLPGDDMKNILERRTWGCPPLGFIAEGIRSIRSEES